MVHRLYSKYDKISKNFAELINESCPSCKNKQSIIFGVQNLNLHCNLLPQSIKSHIFSFEKSNKFSFEIKVESIKNIIKDKFILNDKWIFDLKKDELKVLNPSDDENNLNFNVRTTYFECKCNNLTKRSYFETYFKEIYYLEIVVDDYTIAQDMENLNATFLYKNDILIHSTKMSLHGFINIFAFNENILDGLRNYLLLL